MKDIDFQQLIHTIKDRGLSQREIAWRIGVSETGISDLAIGRRKHPVGMTALRLVELERKTRRKVRNI